jgi:hypothetical protein
MVGKSRWGKNISYILRLKFEEENEKIVSEVTFLHITAHEQEDHTFNRYCAIKTHVLGRRNQ